MKKSIILIGILLAVVIAMVGYYFMNKKQEGFQDQPEFLPRPEQGFYRIKITSLGTDNSDHSVSYMGYRYNNRYIITEDELQSTVFELTHVGDDNETFRLKNTGSINPEYFLGEAGIHYGDQEKDNISTYFKYNKFDELYNTWYKHVMHTNQNNTDKNLMHIEFKSDNLDERQKVKSKITFEKVEVEPEEELIDGKIYKIKLTPVGEPHNNNNSKFKYGETYYIASKTTTDGYLKTIVFSDEEQLFFKIDKMIGSDRFLMYPCDKNGNEIRDNEDSPVAIIRRRYDSDSDSDFLYLDKSGAGEHNESELYTFSYNTYSKMLELPLDNNRRLCLYKDDSDGRIRIISGEWPTFIDQYRTLVEFEEYTPPAQTTNTPALLGGEMGVKSKVIMTPDIRDYINSELNKYTDGSSLPTPEQIEQLSKIVGNNTAEELAKIPNLLNNFKDNTQSYMDFHKSYEEQLEEILRTKFDAEKDANEEIQERNAKRLARLRDEIGKRNNLTTTTTSASADNSLSYGSLRNIGNGTMLNFNKIAGSDTDSNYVMLNMIGEKMVKDGNSYKGDEHGEIQGCLTFDSTNKKLGTPALASCNIDNDTSPELSFNVRKIENIKEYNKLLTEIAPETKYLASEYDTINYPFHVVEPQNLSGFCVSVDDNKVRVLPCEKNSNQRYRKMNYQVKNDCGQNNNGNQS